MSQDYEIPLDPGISVASAFSAVQAALQSTATLFSGSSAPSVTFAGQLWHDTANSILKLRNQADDAWISLIPSMTTGILAVASGVLTVTGKVSGVTAGTAGTDAVNKTQVDGREKVAILRLGTISATGSAIIWAGCGAITVVDVVLVCSGATTSDGSNLWSLQVENLTDTDDLRSSDASTNGADFVANTAKALGLNQNLAVESGDVLQLQYTKTGAATNLADLTVFLRYTVAT